MSTKLPNSESVLAAIKQNGHVVFASADYDLNLIGLRSQPGKDNAFDDYLCIMYKLREAWQFHCFSITTDPGRTYLGANPSVANGTAILQPGQYRSCWTLGHHKGQYEALVQTSSAQFKVWRDKDKDGHVDYSGLTFLDVAGLNLHHAGADSTLVDGWSSGCQVVARLSDWNIALDLFKRQVAAGLGTKYSYTLLDWV